MTELTIEELRAAITDARRARAWRSAERMQDELDDRERVALPHNVVPLVARRRDQS